MKVLVQYTKTGMYKDYVWQAPALRTKGQIHAVVPSEAALLIKNDKANLYTKDNQNIVTVANAF